MARTRRSLVLCCLVATVVSTLSVFCSVSKSVECTISTPAGPGCSGCRNTGFTYTKTTTIMVGIPPQPQQITVNMKICKLCQNQNFDEASVNFGGAPQNGTNPESVANGNPDCGVAATLYYAWDNPNDPSPQCSGAVANPLTDPDLSTMGMAQRFCLFINRADRNTNFIPATKNCATGQPWPPMPPMPPMP
jgi:hypothetical protein